MDFSAAYIAVILKFFESGILPFNRSETLECMKIREGVLSGTETAGE